LTPAIPPVALNVPPLLCTRQAVLAVPVARLLKDGNYLGASGRDHILIMAYACGAAREQKADTGGRQG
jgi:hypothetical protein